MMRQPLFRLQGPGGDFMRSDLSRLFGWLVCYIMADAAVIMLWLALVISHHHAYPILYRPHFHIKIGGLAGAILIQRTVFVQSFIPHFHSFCIWQLFVADCNDSNTVTHTHYDSMIP